MECNWIWNLFPSSGITLHELIVLLYPSIQKTYDTIAIGSLFFGMCHLDNSSAVIVQTF